tara:strand:+ start:1076 stop:2356 length:1281 start_codon:yes stop_codon:yes gene_type:complete
MSYLPYSYLGCYKRKDGRHIIGGTSRAIGNGHNQDSCNDLALKKNKNYFALQYGGGCFIGNDLNIQNKESKDCNKPCTRNNTDTLLQETGIPGCGNIGRHDNRSFSIYKSHKPTNIITKNDKTEKYLDNFPVGQKFKEGNYSFDSSTYCWNHSPDRAFDGNIRTRWHTAYVNRRSGRKPQANRNYTTNPYKGTGEKFKRTYRSSPEDAVRNRKDLKQKIIHVTEEGSNNAIEKNKHYGEWVEINFPYKMIPESFELMGHKSFRHVGSLMKFPRSYVLLGSNEGEGWTKLGQYSPDNVKNGIDLINAYVRKDMGTYNNLRGEPWKHSIIATKSYSKYRLVIKETYGAPYTEIGHMTIKGKICIDMNGNCDKFRQSLNEGFTNNVMETFTNKDEDYIVEESFINQPLELQRNNPLVEKNIFNIGYSKY